MRRMTRVTLTFWGVFYLGFSVMLGAELPPELPLWEKLPQDAVTSHATEEQLRSHPPRADSLSGNNRAYSAVSIPTYSIHRPKTSNGVGLVICPGGGFRDVWIDREGHDLAIWLKRHNVTSLVLKYRTRPAEINSPRTWQEYQQTVRADGRRAIRILREQASELNLRPDRIGISGFSAGGHLALSCSLYPPTEVEGEVSSMPDFAGLFYPGIPEGISEVIEQRLSSGGKEGGICPMFIINARHDRLTPESQCVEFFAKLLKAGVEAELHIFGKGAHGFDLGVGRGESVAIWPTSFFAWLRDCGFLD